PPRAPRHEVATERHGETMTDCYAWMRDPNWQQVMRDPEILGADIRAYLEAENAYTGEMLAPTEAMQKALYEEMKGRLKEDDSSVPSNDGPWAYYHRYLPGAQHPTWRRRPRDSETPEQVLLDADAESKSTAFYRVGRTRHSPDHKCFAYAVDVTGGEYNTIRIRDSETGEVIDEAVDNAEPGFVWAGDGDCLFYIALDENHRPHRVYRHRVGTPSSDDFLVYEEDDAGFFLSLDKTESGRFILIEAHDHSDTTEIRAIESARPDAPPRMIAERDSGVTYEISDSGDDFLILTNAGDAVDFRIMQTAIDAPGRQNWVEVIGHQPGRLILDMLLFEGYLVRRERIDGLPRIVVRRLADGDEHVISFDEEAYHLGLAPGYEYDTTNLRFTYSSMATPERTFDYDMETRRRSLRKEQEIPSGHDPANYVTRRVFATSHDGALVPVSLIHARATPIDGSAPLLLYGYGSYGHAMPASFAPNRFSLIDRGFVYAIAHIRGGADCGYGWYLDGKMMTKRNTFLDFIAAAEKLAADGFTAPGNIVIHGGSAGGMLVGAAANMRPDLFRGVIAEVPFVDVLNTMCDAELPLTPPEWVEWGNPLEDEAAWRYMAGYCPYSNVARQDYPSILATGGLSDPRVTYWEPAKWVAKLREHDTGGALILLRTNMEAGHGGASGRFARLVEVALTYAFATMVCGKMDQE
ncbi:MAG: S9 family peptidase, partial [Alphaproteobacteria bacterium]